MSKISIYVGTELLDFDDEINVKRQLNDYSNLDVGSNVTSYTLNIPNTPNNKVILKNPQDIRSREAVTDTAMIYIDKILILKGKLRILSANEQTAKIIIEGNDWISDLSELTIQDIWDAAPTDCHDFTSANVLASWTAAAGSLYRYPLVNFSTIVSEETGSGSRLMPSDFYPMWNVEKIIEKIFEYLGITIASNFFDSSPMNALYLMSQPVTLDDDFITNKALRVYVNDDSDNYDSTVIAGGSSGVAEFFQVLELDAEAEDEGSDFAMNRYTVPEDGTYRFQSRISIYSEAHQTPVLWTVTACLLQWRIRKNGTAIVSEILTGSTLFDTKEYDLDTGYLNLEAGDYIDVYVTASVTATNDTGASLTSIIYIEAEDSSTYNLQCVWDERNLWPGIGKQISPAEFLPEIDIIAFLQALKQAYDLRFWYDDLNNSIYLITSDDFYGDTVIDISGKEDHSSDIDLVNIATNYNNIQKFRWSEPTGDKSYNNEVSVNGIPLQKILEIDSQYTKSGTIENIVPELYATVKGDMQQIGHYSGKVPKIHGSDDYINYWTIHPANRAKSWNPRILIWNGMVALTTGSFDYCTDFEDTAGTTYTTFPSAECPDMADVFDEYLAKDWRIIEKNKSASMTFKLSPLQLNQFNAVIGTAANEGFRVKYKTTINGVDVYVRVSSMVTNGDLVKFEVVQIL